MLFYVLAVAIWATSVEVEVRFSFITLPVLCLDPEMPVPVLVAPTRWADCRASGTQDMLWPGGTTPHRQHPLFIALGRAPASRTAGAGTKPSDLP